MMKPRVLIARGPARCAALIEALARLDLEGRALPLTRTVALDLPSDPPLDDRWRWIAFTSAEAVRRFIAVDGPARCPEARLAAVGRITAEALRNAGLGPVLRGAGDGTTLALMILAEERDPAPLLWPCADLTAGGFAETLAEAGVTAVRLPLYATQSRPADEIRADLQSIALWQAVLFAAPSAARVWVDLALPQDGLVIAGGNTTARALEALGFRRILRCDVPGNDALAKAISQALDTTDSRKGNA